MSIQRTLNVQSTSSVTRHGPEACWADLISAHIGRSHITEALGSEDTFSGRLTSWRFGELKFVFSTIRGVPMRGIQPAETRQPKLEDVWLCLCLSGGFELAAGRFSTVVDPSRMAVMVDGQPHVVTFAPDSDVLWVRAPKRHFRPLHESSGQLVVDVSCGVGRLALQSLTGLMHQAERLDGDDSGRIVDSTLGLASAAVGHALRDRLGAGGTGRREQLEEIKAFIESRLWDDSLGLESAARALGRSPRHLNRLFETEGTSFMKWTWERRLQRAHRLLTEAETDGPSITDVALDCGFKNLSHFSRVFRQRYGCPPSALRHRPHGQRLT